MKIAIIGDLHYSVLDETVPGLIEARRDFYQAFLEKFLDVEADLHISLGDLTNYGHTEELVNVYSILRESDRNFYHVLGNHDLYAQTRTNVLNITGQKRYHSIITDDVILVFLDTARERDYTNWGGWMDEEQLEWFEGVVKASGTKLLFVFAHHPVYDTTKSSTNVNGSIHPDIDMWKILDQKEGTAIYFNGHTHVESIEQKKNWHFVQLAACLDLQSIRIVELDADSIRIYPLDIENESLRETAMVLHRNMSHFKPNPKPRGEEADYKCKIELVPTNQLV